MATKVKWYGKLVARQMKGAAVDWLKRSGVTLTNEVKLSMKGPAPSPPGSPPAVRTGVLRRSITYEVDSSALVARIGPAANSPAQKYARIHEFGGIIRAKRAKYLRFMIDGKLIQVRQVIMPQRSYLRSNLNKMIKGLMAEARAKRWA